jgi:hypothetical protein
MLFYALPWSFLLGFPECFHHFLPGFIVPDRATSALRRTASAREPKMKTAMETLALPSSENGAHSLHARYFVNFLPATSARARKTTKIIKAAKNRNFAMPALPAAMPVNPKSPAMIEIIAKTMAHLIMVGS